MSISAPLLVLVFALFTSPAHAELTDHAYVKNLIESRFGLAHREVGMTPAVVASADCDIKIVNDDGIGLEDESSILVTKNGVKLAFQISPKMSYDLVRGGFIDLTSSAKSGLVTQSYVLKISSTKLMLTRLSLYPNDEHVEPTQSVTCLL